MALLAALRVAVGRVGALSDSGSDAEAPGLEGTAPIQERGGARKTMAEILEGGCPCQKDCFAPLRSPQTVLAAHQSQEIL